MSRPVATPIWNEARVGLETANLLRSRVFHGEGVHPGAERPVVLIPGFMAGDATLSTMTGWLRRIGYRTSRAGMRANVACSGTAVSRLEERLELMADRYGHKVAIVGQSRGGTMARALAVKRPDLVSGIVCLGSPLTALLAVNPLVMLNVAAVAALGTGRVPGLFSTRCWTGACCSEFRTLSEAAFPDGVGYVSVFSKRDGIVDWRSCLDPAARQVEVGSSHCGMAVDAASYRAIASALHQFGAQPSGRDRVAPPLRYADAA